MTGLIIFLSIIAFCYLLSGVCDRISRAQEEKRRERAKIDFDKKQAEKALLEAKKRRQDADAYFSERIESADAYCVKRRQDADAYSAEKHRIADGYWSSAFEFKRIKLKEVVDRIRIASPSWMAEFMEDLEFQILDTELQHTRYSTVAAYLKNRRDKDRKDRREVILSRYLRAYYESLLPELRTISESCRHDGEELKKDGWWLPEEQYENLSTAKRAQLTLERYILGSKSNWEVGRDYELYCGCILRAEGYDVIQFGVNRRFQDMGRDLICNKGNETLIVQCKFWSQERPIFEKHIAQLFGTTVAYAVENNYPTDTVLAPDRQLVRIIPVFISPFELSGVANQFARVLGVEVRHIVFDPKKDLFPRIKCNIGSGGEKIYHLPSDQKYDDTVIDISRGENYVFSAEEAERLGFRRAKHWMGWGDAN